MMNIACDSKTLPKKPLPASEVIRDLYTIYLSPEKVHAYGQPDKKTKYTPWRVLWLMIYQRLEGNSTLADAVLHFQTTFFPESEEEITNEQELENYKKRFPSSSDGGYSRARKRLPLKVIESLLDDSFKEFINKGSSCSESERVMIFDGTTLTLEPNIEDIRKAYPPGTNQYGSGVWPVFYMVCAHDLETGFAIRPEYGAMYGSKANSELSLGKKLLPRVPKDTIVLGDANFGVFAFAYAADQSGHEILIRLTKSRGESLVKRGTQCGEDTWKLDWRPTRDERKKHADLPEDAMVSGYLYKYKIPSQKKKSKGVEDLYIFCKAKGWNKDKAGAVYKQRQNIETDFRDLKQTLQLDRVTAKTVDMVHKEILVAILTHNLVVQVRHEVARAKGESPRSYSYTFIKNATTLLFTLVSRNLTREHSLVMFELLIDKVSRRKLPKRRVLRHFKREVIARRSRYPPRKRMQAA